MRRRIMMFQNKKSEGWYSDGDIDITEYGVYKLTSLSDDTASVPTSIIATNDIGDAENLAGNWSLYYPKNTDLLIEFSEKYFSMSVDGKIVFEKNTNRKIVMLSFRRGAGTINYHATVNFYVEKIS